MKNDEILKYEILKYEIIFQAINGDDRALNEVVKFYLPYIRSLATTTYTNEKGNNFSFVDDEAVGRMITRLVTRVRCFKPYPKK